MKDVKQMFLIAGLIIISIPVIVWMVYEWRLLLDGEDFTIKSGASFFTTIIFCYWTWWVNEKIIKNVK